MWTLREDRYVCADRCGVQCVRALLDAGAEPPDSTAHQDMEHYDPAVRAALEVGLCRQAAVGAR